MKSYLSVRTIVLASLGAAMMAACSQISISIGPVPFTLQTFIVGFVASTFPKNEARLAVLIYILLGLIGLPVFSKAGATTALFGPTGGYLWGLIAYVFLTSQLLTKKASYPGLFVANLAGDSLVFLFGLVWLHLVGHMPVAGAFTVGVLPFILPDLGKMVAITVLAKTLKERLAGLIGSERP